MFETVSVFDAMELDHTQTRVASRRALALAHHRVEQNLGRFLRAATSEEEFEERLALVLDDFDGYVTSSSKEVAHDKPEQISESLKAHFREAAQPVEFVKTPEEEQKEEDDEEEGKTSRWHIVSVEGKQGAPFGGNSNEYEHFLGPNPHDVPGNNFFDQQGQPAPDPMRNNQGYMRPSIMSPQQDIARDEGYEQIPYEVNPEDPRLQRDYGNDQGLQIAPNLPSVQVPPGAPIRQGTVAAENQNNTDLDGPEPKMDKGKWTPQSVKPLPEAAEDKGRWPTKQKDVTVPIKATNDAPLKEIGETVTERETLPSNSGDAGWSSDGPGPAPHTDTFGNDGQTTPVTREAISAANEGSENPLSKLLLEQPVPNDQIVEAAFKRFKD